MAVTMVYSITIVAFTAVTRPSAIQWIDMDQLDEAAATGSSQLTATDAAVAMILDHARRPEHEGKLTFFSVPPLCVGSVCVCPCISNRCMQ